jgi:hypothetical protein
VADLQGKLDKAETVLAKKVSTAAAMRHKQGTDSWLKNIEYDTAVSAYETRLVKMQQTMASSVRKTVGTKKRQQTSRLLMDFSGRSPRRYRGPIAAELGHGRAAACRGGEYSGADGQQAKC